jgi:hypothetical protein
MPASLAASVYDRRIILGIDIAAELFLTGGDLLLTESRLPGRIR